MAQHLLQYTPWHSIKHGGRPDSSLFFYAASSQFGGMKLQSGDTIWHVSIRPVGTSQRSKLVPCGRLVPEVITLDQREVGRRTGGYIFPAEYHALRRKEAAEQYDEHGIEIGDLAPDLRFEGRQDRLCLVDGPPLGQQLQRIRRLTPESAELLRQRWEQHHPSDGSAAHHPAAEHQR